MTAKNQTFRLDGRNCADRADSLHGLRLTFLAALVRSAWGASKVEEFIVRPDATLSYAIVDVGGFLKIGAHRVAIPVNQFSEVRQGRLVLPGATKDALKQMPEFRYAKNRT